MNCLNTAHQKWPMITIESNDNYYYSINKHEMINIKYGIIRKGEKKSKGKSQWQVIFIFLNHLTYSLFTPLHFLLLTPLA